MAILHPTLPPFRVARSLGWATEMEVLEHLTEGLPAAYTLFHSVDWMRPTPNGAARGEIDIIVVNQAGELLLIEVKAGSVEFRADGIFKPYEGEEASDVVRQVKGQYRSIRQRLDDAGLKVKIQQLLVLPDMVVENETVHWPRELIVDSREYPHLPGHIQRTLGPGSWNETVHEGVIGFLANRFKVRVDVASVLRQAEHTTSVLSSGLATWVPRIHAPEGIYRINATAGSGKTQLALQLLNSASHDGVKAAYSCFNSSLAAVVAQRVRPTVEAQTFHRYARFIYELLGHQPDFDQLGTFAHMSAVAAEHLATPAWQPDLDLLVIDEMQDMEPQWVQALIHRLKPGGRAFLFEDTDQLLYGDREPFSIGGEVTVTCAENARSPQTIIRLINELRLTREPIQGLNPYRGTVAEPRVYRNTKELMAKTAGAVQECLDMGFALRDIAVLSWRGRKASQVLKADTIGPWATRRAAGQRDAEGEEVLTQGDLLCETIHRFKGQATGAVVLTEMEMSDAPINEVDADARSRHENHWHRVYVGLTRAQVHVAMVLSERAEAAMMGRLVA